VKAPARRLSPDDEAQIRKEFHRLTNLSQAELRAWLDTGESRKVGMAPKGDAESVGRPSAQKILEIATNRPPTSRTATIGT